MKIIAVILFYAIGVFLGTAIGMMLAPCPQGIVPAGEIHLLRQ